MSMEYVRSRGVILEECIADIVDHVHEWNVPFDMQEEVHRWYNMWSPDCFGYGPPLKILSMLMTVVSDEQKQLLQRRTFAVAEICLEDGNFYLAQEICDTTGQSPDFLYRYAQRHGIMRDGFPNFDLSSSVYTFGSIAEIDQTIAVNPIHPVLALCDMNLEGKVQEEMCAVRREYAEFCDRHKLSRKHGLFVPDISAAVELRKEHYDLVVAIQHGGAPVANVMKALDQNVSFVEWHRHWKKSPVWKSIGKKQADVQKGLKVLLMENDAASGATLGRVVQSVDAISPSSIDVCFRGLFFDRSKDIAESIHAFSNIFHTTSLPQTRVYSNMLAVRERLQLWSEKSVRPSDSRRANRTEA